MSVYFYFIQINLFCVVIPSSKFNKCIFLILPLELYEGIYFVIKKKATQANKPFDGFTLEIQTLFQYLF